MELTNQSIPRMIDLSCVQNRHSRQDIDEMVSLAKEYQCICCFALPAHTEYLVSILADEKNILVGGVVGFPDGGATTRNKCFEAREMVEAGCDELDMVINIGLIKSNQWQAVAEDIASVKEVVGKIPLKVIMECNCLNEDELQKACDIAAQLGVRFVKTGTGWMPEVTTEDQIRLMHQTVAGRCEVKAAGGVKDLDTLIRFYKAGARRFGIGTHSARSILAALQ